MTGDLRQDVRQELINAASEGETVTYGHLMKKFKISRGHPFGKGIVGVIDEVGRHQEARGAPGFGAIVVRKDTRYPGGGYFCYDELPRGLRRARSRSADPKLSPAEKRFVEREQRMIWDFYGKQH